MELLCADGLDNLKICHPLRKKLTEELKEDKNSAVLIQPSHVFDTWRVSADKHCRFTFKAKKGDGLFAVIHNISFRRNGSECLDYVQVIFVRYSALFDNIGTLVSVCVYIYP